MATKEASSSVDEIEEAPADKKLEIETSDSIYSTTFVLKDEDHTIGNSLRHVLAEDERVDLVGYSIPHPLENKLHLRIQTLRTKPDGSPASFSAVEALQAGCHELKARGAILLQAFDKALDDFHATNN